MKSVLAVVFLFAASAFAYDCESPIVDKVSILGGQTQIATALVSIRAKGGDPRVITDDPDITPEMYVRDVKDQCQSWQSASGGVKNNLIVFLVFPKHHKIGLFVGQEFAKALNTSVIRSQFMAPGFKDHDWTRGFVSGINQAAIQIEAFQTSSLHPGTTVVTEQPTDLSGLWTFLKWLLFLAVLGGIAALVIYFRNRRREQKDAQQRAVQARNDAAERITNNPIGAEVFSRLNNSETFNPDTNGLSVDQYDAMAAKYKGVGVAATPPAKPSKRSRQREESYRSDYRSTSSAAPTGNAPSQSTTIINESPAYIPVPIIVDEPVYVAPAHHPSYVPSTSSDDGGSIFSGGGSDWGGSSGGSDFSGGSSDFGGGGDSGGGGGSSDF